MLKCMRFFQNWTITSINMDESIVNYRKNRALRLNFESVRMNRYIYLLIFLLSSLTLEASVIDSVFTVKNKSISASSGSNEFFEEGLVPSPGITDSAQYYIDKA